MRLPNFFIPNGPTDSSQSRNVRGIGPVSLKSELMVEGLRPS
jgi:hypothetical protein